MIMVNRYFETISISKLMEAGIFHKVTLSQESKNKARRTKRI